MDRRKSLIKISYQALHKALDLKDDVEIESVFITDSDNRSECITIKLSKGPHLCPDGYELVSVPLGDMQKIGVNHAVQG